MTLASFCGCAGRFESTLVGNPEDRFSRDEAYMQIAVSQYSEDKMKQFQTAET